MQSSVCCPSGHRRHGTVGRSGCAPNQTDIFWNKRESIKNLPAKLFCRQVFCGRTNYLSAKLGRSVSYSLKSNSIIKINLSENTFLCRMQFWESEKEIERITIEKTDVHLMRNWLKPCAYARSVSMGLERRKDTISLMGGYLDKKSFGSQRIWSGRTSIWCDRRTFCGHVARMF